MFFLTDDTLHLPVVSVGFDRESVPIMPLEYVSDVERAHSVDNEFARKMQSVTLESNYLMDTEHTSSDYLVHDEDSITGVAEMLVLESGLHQANQLQQKLDNGWSLELTPPDDE